MQTTNVLQYLDETVTRVPDKPAFCSVETSLTFRELFDRSCAIGSALCAAGCGGAGVVVFMKKSPATISAFFGVVRAGGYYVPVDEEMPLSRVEVIFETLRPKAIIFDETTRALVKNFDFSGQTFDYHDVCSSVIDEVCLTNVRRRAIDTDLIYVVFTSGSTGKPKGVAACHRSVIDYVENLSDVLQCSESTIFGNQAPFYVDACLKELYPTCKFGAQTWLIPKSYFSFPMKLIEFLNEKKINTVCWVASAFTLVASLRILDEFQPKWLHTIAFGSEIFPIKQLNAWRNACPEARFVNLYGPTEATGMSCFYELDREFFPEDKVPIGRAFPNTDVFLIDSAGQRIEAIDVPGELCIRGTCLTFGYFGDSERTNQSFVQNPFHHSYEEKIYRTGDLAYYNQQGELVFSSRIDHQIKRAGYRVELGEIEIAAQNIEKLEHACCVYDDIRKKIILVYVGALSQVDVIEALKTKVPSYMIPNIVKSVERLPLTTNGKVDRRKLLEFF